jgi:DNA-binding GntR family transcriptional regulator
VRDALELDPDERVVSVTRVGQVDGLPAWYGTSYLPLELVGGVTEHLADDISIHQILRDRFGLAPAHHWVRAELVVVPVDVAPHLGVEGRPLVWFVERCTADQSVGRPVELSVSWLRPDVYRIRFVLGVDR